MHCPLGKPGGARGIHDKKIVFTVRGHWGLSNLLPQYQLLVIPGKTHFAATNLQPNLYVAPASAHFPNLFDSGSKLRIENDCPGATIFQYVGDLAGSQTPVNGHRDQSNPCTRKKRFQKFMPIECQ